MLRMVLTYPGWHDADLPAWLFLEIDGDFERSWDEHGWISPNSVSELSCGCDDEGARTGSGRATARSSGGDGEIWAHSMLSCSAAAPPACTSPPRSPAAARRW